MTVRNKFQCCSTDHQLTSMYIAWACTLDGLQNLFGSEEKEEQKRSECKNK